MTHPRPFGGFNKLLAGIILLTLGILFLFNWIDASKFFDLWPLILIFFGISKAMEPHRRGVGLFLILFGFWILLSNFLIIPFSPWDMWPLILILLGGALVWQAVSTGRSVRAAAGETGFLSATAILGGTRHQVSSRDFRGANVTAVLGGCEIDLRDAVPGPDGAVIDVFALWGGIEIRVPEDWRIDLRGRPILGGFADNRTRQAPEPKHTVVIKGTAVMGGVEIES